MAAGMDHAPHGFRFTPMRKELITFYLDPWVADPGNTSGGVRLEPGLTGMLMPEVVPGLACLNFWRRELGPSVLGNVHMQEHIWEFDSVKDHVQERQMHHTHPTSC
ncbi:hypothetical protein ZWY2020_005554 [Hordeum vulgare]|nr:hypothetical protein ZWY2020_005554 [Hordeum vulgare]